MASETYRDAVRADRGIRSRLRQGLRAGLLHGLSLAPPRREERFLRCLNAHFVFDDQRKSFAQTLAALKGMGDFVTTADAVRLVRGEVPLDGRYFHLSFDDGLACLLDNAAPILDAAEVPAIVFVNSAIAADPDGAARATWLAATNYRERIRVLDWEGLAALAAAGFEIGAHTRSHWRLSGISGDAALLAAEVAGCKAEIEVALGRDCRYFAWPYGRMGDINAAGVAAIRAAGYAAAFGVYRVPVRPGRTNPFMIPRCHFEPHWPLRWVVWFARGGYGRPTELPDW